MTRENDKEIIFWLIEYKKMTFTIKLYSLKQ